MYKPLDSTIFRTARLIGCNNLYRYLNIARDLERTRYVLPVLSEQILLLQRSRSFSINKNGAWGECMRLFGERSGSKTSSLQFLLTGSRQKKNRSIFFRVFFLPMLLHQFMSHACAG